MARTERVTALVLDRTPYKEYDRLYTLLTLERGLVRARARGAAKPKAKVRPHVEGFGLVDIMLIDGRAGAILASAEMLEPLRMPGYETQQLAEVVRRTLARVLREQDPDGELFLLVRDFLRDLSGECGERGADVLALREMHFFWSLLGSLGYNGSSDHCNLCGTTLNGHTRFVPLAGAFFCESCAKGAGEPVAPETRTFLAAPFRIDATPQALAFSSALAEHFSHRLDMQYPACIPVFMSSRAETRDPVLQS